jgi:flagellar FliL protein
MSPKKEDKAEEKQMAKEEDVKPNQTKWGLIIALILVQVIAAVAIVYFLIVPRLWPEPPGSKDEKAKVEKSAKKEPGVIYTISDITINPKDSYGRRFAVFAIALEVPDDDATAELDKMKPIIMDRILQYLRSKTVTELTTTSNVEQIKADLKADINDILGHDLVQNLYFTKFVLE